MSSDDKDDRKSRGEIAPEDRDAIHQRSTDLGRKLEEARQGRVAGAAARNARGAGSDRGQAMGRALRVSAELIGGIVVAIYMPIFKLGQVV